MSYFSDHYSAVSLPFESADLPGLRNAQIGSIHAIASHFTLRAKSGYTDPALVVMPTGSGKTAVLLASAYLLRAERVLIISPSRAVRNQIADEAATLAILKNIGVLPKNLDAPRVHEVSSRLSSTGDWNNLSSFDIVVGTPNSVSPGTKGVVWPPTTMFDLVLMDEAHHSPAPTWKAIIAAFQDARKVLFTATPFRLDEKEIRARAVYEYSLGQALDDDIICQLDFMPVRVERGEDRDVVLARRAEEILRDEQAKNAAYRLLVRTDRKTHSTELEKIYADNTDLKLRTVHSGHSQRYVDASIKQLRDGSLDGVICVDMLGEGFDFPPLKVAAIHRKHKSLPVTLQFIGRFGRVTRKLGAKDEKEKARVLAVPEELEGEITRLYDENSSWERIIPMLHETRIQSLRETRIDLSTFRVQKQELPDKLDEISLWGLEPLAHVKIYEVDPGINVDIDRDIQLAPPFKLVYAAASQELSAKAFLSLETTRPPWANADVMLFNRVEYDLFIVHWNEPARLLFISASRRGSIALYEEIAKKITGQTDEQYRNTPGHHILPLYKINRVIRGHSDSNCFNVGIRNRQTSLATESYRIIAGSEVDRALNRTDGRLFHRGHVFLGIMEEDRMVTLGYSSASKVWRGKHLRIPELIKWCRELAGQIADSGPVLLGKNLDFIPVGEPLTELPEDVISVAWNDEVYQRSNWLIYNVEAGKEQEHELYESNWEIDREMPQPEHFLQLRLKVDEKTWPVHFSLSTKRLFTSDFENANLPQIRTLQERLSLLDYINNNPLSLFTADFSRICGREIFKADEKFSALDQSRFRPLGWRENGVIITTELRWSGKEYTKEGFDIKSVQGFFADHLAKEGFEIIFYDHGSGEIADFIALEEKRRGEVLRWEDGKEEQDSVHVYLFHVKGSGGEGPSVRVNDAYEVCGQVEKSLTCVKNRKQLIKRIERRHEKRSFFIRGDLKSALEILNERKRLVNFHIGLVQPGISAEAAKENDKIQEVIAAANDHIKRAVGNPIYIFSSS